jgi:hypothetical protein
LQHAFPLNVLMVPSSTPVISTDDEHLTCSGFSHGETICLGSFESIADYFGGLSLCLRRNNSGTTFMGSTYSGPLSLRHTMIEDSTEEFHMASSRGGGSGLPSPRRLGKGAVLGPVTTTTWQEDAPTIRYMTTVPPWALALRPDNSHSFE